jgi:hypothetical protein
VIVEFDGKERVGHAVPRERTSVLAVHRVDEYVVGIGLDPGTVQNGTDAYPPPRKVLRNPALDTLEIVCDRLDGKLQ